MFTRALERIDRISEHVLLLINIGLAVVVGLAHGAGLLIGLFKEPECLKDVLPLAAVTVPVSLFVIISSLIVFRNWKYAERVLRIHALILTLGACICLLWAIGILLRGFPEGRFGWSPGLLTFICVYPAYLFRRFVVTRKTSTSGLKYLHVIVLVIALVVDITVFVQTLQAGESRSIHPPRTVRNAQSLVGQGRAALQRGLLEESESFFDRAIAVDPDLAEAWIGRGMLLIEKGDRAQARAAYERALRIHEEACERQPSDTKHIQDRIFTTMLLGHEEEAKRLLAKDRDQHPDDYRLKIFSRTFDDPKQFMSKYRLEGNQPPQQE